MLGYSGLVKRLLRRVSANVGDRILVEVRGKRYEGVLLPRTELGASDHIVLKLQNGYNVGVKVTKDTRITLMEMKKPPSFSLPPLPQVRETGKSVTILGTGGTIASRVDYRTGAVYPAFTPGEIYGAIPELAEIADIKVVQVCNVFSEHMNPDLWVKTAKVAAREIRNGASGVVIAHGTDTLGYTAAALSFMLRGLYRPVVMVGSQRSSDRPSTDAALNLMSATTVAAHSDIAEVMVVMHGSMDDNACLIHRGTKVRKCHTSRRDAFLTVNDLPLGKVSGRRIEMLRNDYRRVCDRGRIFIKGKFERRVALLKVTPGFPSEILERLIGMGFRGFVIEGTGLGHVPESLFRGIRKATDRGLPVVMTSQCLWGRVNMKVYSTGRDLLELGVIPGEDMLPETAWVKLMWVLGQTKNQEKVRVMMMKNIAGEITKRTLPEAYAAKQMDTL